MAERPVSASISLAVVRQLSMLRLAITTSAPQRAAPNAISRPSPRLPPVISTTRSVRSKNWSAYPISVPLGWQCPGELGRLSDQLEDPRSEGRGDLGISFPRSHPGRIGLFQHNAQLPIGQHQVVADVLGGKSTDLLVALE